LNYRNGGHATSRAEPRRDENYRNGGHATSRAEPRRDDNVIENGARCPNLFIKLLKNIQQSRASRSAIAANLARRSAHCSFDSGTLSSDTSSIFAFSVLTVGLTFLGGGVLGAESEEC